LQHLLILPSLSSIYCLQQARQDLEALEAKEWREKFKARVRLFTAGASGEGLQAGSGRGAMSGGEEKGEPVLIQPKAPGSWGAQAVSADGGADVMQHFESVVKVVEDLVGEVRTGVEGLVQHLSPVTSPKGEMNVDDVRASGGGQDAVLRLWDSANQDSVDMGTNKAASSEQTIGSSETVQQVSRPATGVDGASSNQSTGDAERESLQVSVDADARTAFLAALAGYKAKMSQIQAASGDPHQSPPLPTSPPASLERKAAARACEFPGYRPCLLHAILSRVLLCTLPAAGASGKRFLFLVKISILRPSSSAPQSPLTWNLSGWGSQLALLCPWHL
jgi:hypothetical protein